MDNAISATTARRRFSAVRADAADCRRCELWERATQTVFGNGPVPAPLMLVGEQPGDKEDLEGQMRGRAEVDDHWRVAARKDAS